MTVESCCEEIEVSVDDVTVNVEYIDIPNIEVIVAGPPGPAGPPGEPGPPGTGSGAVEVEVGPGTPANSTVLLWVDTDEDAPPTGAGFDDAPADGSMYARRNEAWMATAPVLVLGPADPVPGGTPAGTVIVRTVT